MRNNPKHCGAKTRNGKKCRSKPMPNGRCRMHGGTSTGAPPGNAHALKHGIYSRALTPSDQSDLPAVREAVGSLDHELAIARLQLTRALKAQSDADQSEDGLEATERIERDGSGRVYANTEKKYTRREYADIINRLLGRIESLEKTRAELIAKTGPDPDDVRADMARQDVFIAPDEHGPAVPVL